MILNLIDLEPDRSVLFIAKMLVMWVMRVPHVFARTCGTIWIIHPWVPTIFNVIPTPARTHGNQLIWSPTQPAR